MSSHDTNQLYMLVCVAIITSIIQKSAWKMFAKNWKWIFIFKCVEEM